MPVNKEAITHAYKLFKADGYGDTLDDFKELLKSNPEALDYSFKLFEADGYGDSKEDYQDLVIDETEVEDKVEIDPTLEIEATPYSGKPIIPIEDVKTGTIDETVPFEEIEKDISSKEIERHRKEFDSVEKEIRDNIESEEKKEDEQKIKDFEKGLFSEEQEEEYKEFVETGEIKPTKFDEEKIQAKVDNAHNLLLQDVDGWDRQKIYYEQYKKDKESRKNLDINTKRAIDNIDSLKSMSSWRKENIDNKAWTQDDENEFVKKYNSIIKSTLSLKESIMSDSRIIEDNSKFLDAYKRSYSDIDKLENVLLTTGTDIVSIPFNTAEYLTGKESKIQDNLVKYRQELAKISEEELAKPMSVEDIEGLGQVARWAGDALINFVPSGMMLFTGPAALPLFFASGYGSRSMEFKLEERKAEDSIPKLQEILEKTENPSQRKEIQEEIDYYNKVLSTSDLKKFLTSSIYGTSELLTEKFTTLRLFNKVKGVGGSKALEKFYKNAGEKGGFSEALKKSIWSKDFAYDATKGILYSPGLEGFGEGLNSLVGNIADRHIIGKDVSYMEGVPDATAQGALIGNGFSVAKAGVIGRAALLDVISSRQDKIEQGKIYEDIANLTNDLKKIPSKETKARQEILKTIKNKLKEAGLKQDYTASAFIKLPEDSKKEIFELDRKSHDINKRWVSIASSNADLKTQERLRDELQKQFDGFQRKKRDILSKSNSLKIQDLIQDKESTFIKKADGLAEGDIIQKVMIFQTYVNSINQHNKKSKVLKKQVVMTLQEQKNIEAFLKSEKENTLTLKDGSVIDKKDAEILLQTIKEGAEGGFINGVSYNIFDAAVQGNEYTPLHEYTHGLFKKNGFTEKQYTKIQKKFKDLLSKKLNNKEITQEQYDKIFTRLNVGYNEKSAAEQSEELLVLTGDALAFDILKENENTDFTTEITQSIKNFLRKIVGKEEANNFNIDNAENAFNLIKTINKNVLKDRKTQVKAVTQPEDVKEDDKIKFSKTALYKAIQDLVPKNIKTKIDYQNFLKGKDFPKLYNSITQQDGAINNYIKSITSPKEFKLMVENVSDRVLGFNPQAVRKDGDIVGIEAFVERIMSDTRFSKLEAKKELAIRNKKIKQEVSIDDTNITTQLADETSVDLDTKLDSTPIQRSSFLRRELNIKKGDDAYNTFKKIAKKIFNEDIDPGLKSTQVRKDINKAVKNEKDLKNTIENIISKEKSIDEQFLNKSIEKILKNLSLQDLAKLQRGVKEDIFVRKVKKLTKKAEVEKAIAENKIPQGTGITTGPILFERLPIDLKQVKEFFIGEDKNQGSKRKVGLVNVLIENLIKEAAPEVTKGLVKKGKMTEAKRAKLLDDINQDPDILFSKSNIEGKHKLTPKQLALVKKKSAILITSINNAVEKEEYNYKNATLLALKEHLSEANITDDVLEDYAKKLSKIAPKFIKNLKDDLVKEGEFIDVAEEALELWASDVTIFKMLSLSGKIGKNFDDTNQLETFRKIQDKYHINLIEKLGDLKGTVYILKFLKEFNTTAGKIGGGRYQGYASSKDWFDSFNENLKDKGIEIIYKKTGKGLIPVNIKIKGIKQFEDAKALDKSIKNASQSNNSKKDKLIKEYKARKKEAGEAFDAMVDYLDYVKKNGDKTQFGMSLMALKSNMRALGKRVAYPKYFYKGKAKGEIRFEHMYPSLELSKNMVDYFYGKGVDLETLKKNQVVAMIPVEMDSRINILHQESMPSWWKLGMNVLARYYNALNKGFKDMYALESIGGTDKGRVYGTNFLALNNSILKSSKINNKILPKKDQLKGEFTNDQVIDKIKEVDNKNKEEAVKFSKSLDLNKDFNDIIESKTGIASEKVYAKVKAQVAGANKGRFKFFIPPSAEDFVGLLYTTLAKGKLGDSQMAWYKAHLLDPYARAMNNINSDRLTMLNDYKALKKQLKIVPKNLRKKLPGEPFTKEQAVRVYIWNKQGIEIPGLSKADLKELTDYVEKNSEFEIFANQLIAINKGDGYAAPKEYWTSGNIASDLLEGLNTTKRAKYLELWQQNVDQIFSEANLNKLEAAYGKGYREALEGMLQRMKTGRNRINFGGADGLVSRFTDWLTNSIGAIMFFNTRSAVLQTISMSNYINFRDNNPLAAAKALLNIKQYSKDFIYLMNSDLLKARRDGLRMNVSESDIADMAKDPSSMAKRFIAWTLKKGFIPTQFADSFAIASGGATFYRNRVNKYIKEGMNEKAAEKQAFLDFQELTETSQQSSRPDKISKQQAGPLGRIILAFANTPMQYTREIKKAALDLKNGRGDVTTNISKILYYGMLQNLIFNALQQALFAIAFDEDEEEEKTNKRYFDIANSMSDQFLRGIGVYGAVVSTMKNTLIKLNKEMDKKSPKYNVLLIKELAQVSPPLGSKVRKLDDAGRAFSWNKKEIKEKGWAFDNPAYLASANIISALTNVPADRAIKKISNISNAMNTDLKTWQRVASFGGWSDWQLGIDKPEKKKKAKTKRKSTKRRQLKR